MFIFWRLVWWAQFLYFFEWQVNISQNGNFHLQIIVPNKMVGCHLKWAGNTFVKAAVVNHISWTQAGNNRVAYFVKIIVESFFIKYFFLHISHLELLLLDVEAIRLILEPPFSHHKITKMWIFMYFSISELCVDLSQKLPNSMVYQLFFQLDCMWRES